jgi:hypothetical protein
VAEGDIKFNLIIGVSEPGIEPAVSNILSTNHIHYIMVFGYLVNVEIWTEFDSGL